MKCGSVLVYSARAMRTFTRLASAAALLLSLTVFAKDLQEYNSSGGHTAEEIEAMKRNSRYQVNDWSGDVSQEVTPFPWAAVTLAVIVILGATPFALRMYRNTSKEVASANTFGSAGKASLEE